MDPLVPFVLAGVAVATACDLRALRPHLLLPSFTPPRSVRGSSDGLLWQLYVLVPCPAPSDHTPVSEIDATVEALLAAHPSVQVVVIDRGAPGPVMAHSDRVAVVHVTGPEAENAAAFLNAGVEVVLLDAQRRSLDPSRVVVGVVSATSRCSHRGLDVVLAAFADPACGGVQVAVETDDRVAEDLHGDALAAWAADQMTRARTPWFGAPWLEGIGQFTRLTALLQVDQRPWWTTVEAEDLDLAASLLADGWHVTTTNDARVTVPPPTDLGAVTRQRVRHQRGTLGSALRLSELWHSDDIDNRTLVVTTARLLVPWIVLGASTYLLFGMLQLVLSIPRGDLGHLGIPAVAALAYLASRVIVAVRAVRSAEHLPVEPGTLPWAAYGLAVSPSLSALASLRALGRIVLRIGPLVGVDEFTTHSVGLAVPAPRRRPLPPMPIGPARLRARIHQTPTRARRRR